MGPLLRTRNAESIATSAESCGSIVVKFVQTDEKSVEILDYTIVGNSEQIDVICGMIGVSFVEIFVAHDETKDSYPQITQNESM